jgi:hypothetical protein
MSESTSTRTVSAPGDKAKSVKTKSFHCEKCNQFMRSEDYDDSDGE